MGWIWSLRERLATLLRPAATEKEMDDEFRFHLEKVIERNLERGMSPEEARRAAYRDFGGIEKRKEETRDETGARGIIDLHRDIRTAFRSLRKNPGYTTIAVLTLAVGIGANTAIFSVVSGVLLQSLPFEEPDRLVAIWSRFTPESGYDIPKYPIGSPEYFDYLNQNRTMEEVAAVSSGVVTISAGEGEPEHITAANMTASLLPVLRIQPLIGRNISEEEDLPGGPQVLLISYDLWQRRFGGDPEVIGQSIDIGLEGSEGTAAASEIIGVMPEGFAFPERGVEMWYSLQLDPARTWRGGHWFSMVARLAPGVSFKEARAEMETIMANWAEVYPDHHVGHDFYMTPLLDDYVGEIRPALLLLFGVVGFVLLIACLNVASLLMARGESRRLEIAVRGALGAGRRRLLKQLLTESVILSLLGGTIGVLLSRVGVRALLAIDAGSIPREELIGLDGRVLAFTAAVVILTSLVFGLMPAFQATSVKIAETLKDGGRGMTAGAGRLRFRRMLVVTEIALAIMLVTGSGLMIKSFRRLVQVDPGFATGNLLAVRLTMPSGRYTPEQAFRFYRDLTERIRVLPGVEDAAAASRPPLLYPDYDSRFHVDGWPGVEEGGPGTVASAIIAGHGLFETLGVRLIRGRLIDETDREGTMKVAVIDEEMARRYWQDEDPIGDRFHFAMTDGPRHTIVGIVENVRWNGLNVHEPTFYFSHEQFIPWAGFLAYGMTVMVSTTGDPVEMVEPIRGIIHTLDPDLPILSIQTMDEIASASVADSRFMMTLLGVFAAMALLLGTVGIYGVISYGVAQRTNEIGIRMTMGARAQEIIVMVVRQGLMLALIGAAIGLLGAVAATTLIEGFLFGVSPTDPWTYLTVALLMVAVTLAACYLPALRASRVDPMRSLRVE